MLTPMLRMQVAPDVGALGLRGRYFVIQGLKNLGSDPEFDRYRKGSIEEILKAWPSSNIEDDPALGGFRALHRAAGVKDAALVASPYALMRSLTQKGMLPNINLLVDIYNLVSLQTRLAIGAHDVQRISGGVSLRRASGKERFIPLGSSMARKVGCEEYCYFDEEEVLCRLEVRQAEKTRITIETSDAYYIVQGNGRTSREEIESAADRLVSLTRRFCGGKYHHIADV